MISFKKTSIFLYIFCNFDTVELQKILLGKGGGFLKTDHGLLCTPDLVYCLFELIRFDATISVNYSILFVYISLFFRPILSGGNS